MLSKRKSESGQVIVLAAGAMILIIGMAALAVDIGFLYSTRRNMQTAADAAAIAGSNALKNKCGITSGCTCDGQAVCASAGKDVATLNGYTTSTGGTHPVTVRLKSPSPAPSPSNGVYVEADVTEPVPTFFLRALGLPTVPVTTTSIAGYGPAPNCITSLSPNDPNALSIQGGPQVKANCGAVVDSNSSTALVVKGGSLLQATSTGVVGGKDVDAGEVQPNPPGAITGVGTVTDPLLSLAAPPPCPSSGGCAGVACAHTNYHPSTNTSTTAGVYCGGITVSGGHSLSLGPGTYILVGGGVNVSGGSSLTGSEVTFYNTYSAAHAYTQMSFNGGSATTLSAPTSGDLNNILFFQDRTAPPGNSYKNTVSAASGTFTGTLYFPTQNLVFQGGSSGTATNSTLVAYTITFTGGLTTLGVNGGGPGQTPAVTTSRLYK